MKKYRITLVQSKALVIEIEGKDSIVAASTAKTIALSHKLFEPRIGTLVVADLQEIEKDDT